MSEPDAAADPDEFRAPHRRRDDFLGVFGVLRRGDHILMVQNDRVVHGVPTRTWDLPGGQVEQGELLLEALARELHEELSIVVRGEPRFLFFQEGERRQSGARRHAWRSFFYAVDAFDGDPRASAEVLDAAWLAPAVLLSGLDAPYHDSFRRWLAEGGTSFHSVWND